MEDSALHIELERRGFAKESAGGNITMYRFGEIVVSGFDGDMPSQHWYRIGVYADYLDGSDCFWSVADGSELPDLAGADCNPRDIFADIIEAQKRSLAYRFNQELRAQLPAEQIEEIQRRNATPKYGDGVCASHDFCDANMVMADAFASVMGRDLLPDEGEASEADCALWSGAWMIAKRDYLTA